MASFALEPDTTGDFVLSPSRRSVILKALDDLCRTTLRNKKSLQRMLVYIVTKTLERRDESLKEYSIATLVFKKKESFDPRLSSLVRTQACKLRRALVEHYTTFPNQEGPWIWVPPGSYHPRFDFNPAQRATAQSQNSLLEPQLSSRLPRVAAPITLSRGSDLRSIAEGVVRMQHEHLTWREGIDRLALKVSDRHRRKEVLSLDGGNVPTIEQTVVELDGCLLLTMCLTAGTARSVIYAHSLSVPWNGNVDRALAEVGPHVSDFASSCLSLVSPIEAELTSQALPTQPTPSLASIRPQKVDSVPNG